MVAGPPTSTQGCRMLPGPRISLLRTCLTVAPLVLLGAAASPARTTGFLTEHDMLTEREVWTRVHQADPLRGEYGYLTVFDGITEVQARARVRHMVEAFGILEFQLYSAFEGYSRPPDVTKDHWECADFHKPVRRSIIRAYTDEIAHLGGRSWLYVQAMATDPGDISAQSSAKVLGQHRVDGRTLLDVVALDAVWAGVIAPQWAEFASSLGCSGIHWDTLGDFGNRGAASGIDIAGFLRGALPVLRSKLLAQTCNFVDGFGWESTLMEGVGWVGNVVAFPYWEVWTVPTIEDLFFKQVAAGPRGGGVFVCYPGSSPTHEGERQNKQAHGIWPLDLLIGRWQKARCNGNSYLVIGDGNHHAQGEYLPASQAISPADIRKIRQKVFTDNTACERYPGVLPAQTFVKVVTSPAEDSATDGSTRSARSTFQDQALRYPPPVASPGTTGTSAPRSPPSMFAATAAATGLLAMICFSALVFMKNKGGNDGARSPTGETARLYAKPGSDAQQELFPMNNVVFQGDDLESLGTNDDAGSCTFTQPDCADGNAIHSAGPAHAADDVAAASSVDAASIVGTAVDEVDEANGGQKEGDTESGCRLDDDVSISATSHAGTLRSSMDWLGPAENTQ